MLNTPSLNSPGPFMRLRFYMEALVQRPPRQPTPPAAPSPAAQEPAKSNPNLGLKVDQRY